MEELELVSFQLISNVGDARSSIFEALKASREERFEDAEKFMVEADAALLRAQDSHSSLIMKEASGERVEVSLLLMHAEDQLMTTEMLKAMAKEMILTHKKYSK
ncbi:MAG: PTS lactose/cellobiose transporter subunit IIA [Clostridium sp.]